MNHPEADGALAGKAAMVTGGSRGIGLAIARRLARAGAGISIVGRDEKTLDETAASLKALHVEAHGLSADLADPESCQAVLDRHMERFGRIDILVNNAAAKPSRKPIMEVPRESFERLFAVNVTAYFILCQAAARDMRRRGWGRILNITSSTGLKARPGMGDYAITKATEVMLTRQLSVEVGQYGITVNAIAPTLTRTDFSQWQWEDEEEKEKVMRVLSIKRLAEPDDVAALAAFLASDEAGMITGTVIPVDGGALA